MRNRFVIRTLIVMLVLVLGDSLYAVSYTPNTYTANTTEYTSSYTSTTDPSLVTAPTQLATTLEDDSENASGPANAIARVMDPDDDAEPGTPLGDGWILLLFALIYATYIAFGTIHTRLRKE